MSTSARRRAVRVATVLLHAGSGRESSLYPALQRLTLDGYIRPEWGVSENNRRARYCTLTAAGRKHLTAERQEFDRVVTAMRLVLDAH